MTKSKKPSAKQSDKKLKSHLKGLKENSSTAPTRSGRYMRMKFGPDFKLFDFVMKDY